MTTASAETTLEELMSRYVDGDLGAFEQLYRRTAPRLRGYLARVSRDPALADDVLQITFAKLHRARGSYERGAKVVPWLLVIARRSLWDERRGLRARGECLTEDGTLPEPPPSPPAAFDEASSLHHALAELPGHYREAIELTKLQGLSGGEAARVLSTTESAVKLRVHRGYRMLRERLVAEAA
jgi:RNA polymerase sigma-70 factor (ECF subfamily)